MFVHAITLLEIYCNLQHSTGVQVVGTGGTTRRVLPTTVLHYVPPLLWCSTATPTVQGTNPLIGVAPRSNDGTKPVRRNVGD